MEFKRRSLGVFEILTPVASASEKLDAEKLRALISTTLQRGVKNICINFSDFTNFDNHTFNVLKAVNKTMLAQTGRLTILSTNPSTTASLDNLGLSAILRIYQSEDEISIDSKEILRQTESYYIGNIRQAAEPAAAEEADQASSEPDDLDSLKQTLSGILAFGDEEPKKPAPPRPKPVEEDRVIDTVKERPPVRETRRVVEEEEEEEEEAPSRAADEDSPFLKKDFFLSDEKEEPPARRVEERPRPAPPPPPPPPPPRREPPRPRYREEAPPPPPPPPRREPPRPQYREEAPPPPKPVRTEVRREYPKPRVEKQPEAIPEPKETKFRRLEDDEALAGLAKTKRFSFLTIILITVPTLVFGVIIAYFMGLIDLKKDVINLKTEDAPVSIKRTLKYSKEEPKVAEPVKPAEPAEKPKEEAPKPEIKTEPKPSTPPPPKPKPRSRPAPRREVKKPAPAPPPPKPEPAKKSPPPPPPASDDDGLSFDEYLDDEAPAAPAKAAAPAPPPPPVAAPPKAPPPPPPVAAPPPKAASGATNSVFISSSPPTAEILLNGKVIGIANRKPVKLPAGKHTLVLRKGSIQKEVTVTVIDGKNKPLFIKLR